MNRVKSASGWCAAVVAGLLLALPAAAAKDPEKCRGECERKVSTTVEACTRACPKGPDEAATGKCMMKCGEKYRTAMEGCGKSCPAPQKQPQTH